MKFGVVFLIGILFFANYAFSDQQDRIWKSFQRDYCGKEIDVKKICEESESYSEFESKTKKQYDNCEREVANKRVDLRKLPDDHHCHLNYDAVKQLYKVYFAGAKSIKCAPSASAKEATGAP